MKLRTLLGIAVGFALLSCGESEGGPDPDPQLCEGLLIEETVGRIRVLDGQDQCAPVNNPLPTTLRVLVTSAGGAAQAGVTVRWSIVSGNGDLSADSSVTDGNGRATVAWILGVVGGGQFVRATVDGVPDTALFHATAQGTMAVLTGGNNVPERYSSDLWVREDYAYTGTWGFRTAQGNALKVWSVTGGAPVIVDSVKLVGVGTVSDNEVTADGAFLLATGEGGNVGANGLYLYQLTDPAHPGFVASEIVPRGLHTGTFAEIAGVRYVFAARNPHSNSVAEQAALMVFRIQPDSADKIVQVAAVIQPENYGIHDQFYRDGLVFASVWDVGLRIYDVGGSHGGSPATPFLVSTIVTGEAGAGCHCVHNAWWYHDAAGGKRYVFVGQEGPGSVGSSSSGDIHVVDITDPVLPVEVAFYHLAGAGVHNFWMDEAKGILYAAYYNGGVVALDVTGTLAGDLGSREIARVTPGGASPYVWGVMLADGALWATDMESGLWKLSPP